MILITLLAAAMVIPVALFDQYLVARSESFLRQHRSEMSRFRALLG